MSPAHTSPVHVSPAHIPVHIPSTCVPSTQTAPCPQPPCWGTAAASMRPSAASLHGAWGLVFLFNRAQEVPECAGLSTGWWVGDRAAQARGTTEQGVAPAWPRGAASLSPWTLGLERRPPRPCATPALAVPATSPAGGQAPGRGKAWEMVGRSRRALPGEQQINTQPSPSMRVTRAARWECREPSQQTCPVDSKRSCWAPH